MRLDVSPAGEIDIWMPVTPPMLNGLGFCHGGMIVTLADTAMAFTLIARHEAGFVTAWLNTTFAFSAQLGDVLHTRTAIVSETKKTTLVDVTVFKQDGVDIAHVRGQLIHLAGNKS
jgi:acyl-CoA thioesterase